ncbi:MAG: gamma-glutamylcyclotransferase [Deinococcus-Thermus bacterium]|nr:gamma-glutamylcyclotransferase [Deinococcota bacterium]
MSDTRFFGYGSLVNRATHAYGDPRPARLAGWRRVWVHTALRPVAYLSVEPADTEIAGLVADVPGGDWAALDAREAAYDKRRVVTRLHACGSDAPARVYAVPTHHAAPPDTRHPVLLSYIDTVVQGFLDLFGEAGAAEFFATTAGWGGPIADDRAAPRYPRATELTRAERAVVDAGLARAVDRA